MVAVGVLLALDLAWLAAAEADLPAGGLLHHQAVAKAMDYLQSSTPMTEDQSIPGPYLFLGWGVRDARPWYRMVWAVKLSGNFVGDCRPSEAASCFPEQTETVVIDYVTGEFVIKRYER